MAVTGPPETGDRRRAVRDYLSAIGPLAGLVWSAGPLLLCASIALTVVSGALPAANIVVVSRLLQSLADAAGSGSTAPGSTASSEFVLLLVLLAVVNLLGQVAGQLTVTVGQLHGLRIGNLVQRRIAAKTAEVDLASFEDRLFHDRMRVVTDQAPHRPRQMVDELLRGIGQLTTFGSLAGILAAWRPWVVGVLVLASTGVLWVSTRFGSAQVELISSRAETERKKYYLSNLLISDQSAKEVRLFGLRNLLLGRFGALLDTMYGQDRRLAGRQLAWALPAGILLAAVEAALIAYTAVQALGGQLTVGQFNQYMLSIVQLGVLLPSLGMGLGQMHQGNLYAGRLFEFLATPIQVERSRPASTPTRSAARPVRSRPPHIVFDEVAFAYPGKDHRVLDGVSFELAPGGTVALVGLNGAGKSTVIKLLAGLYLPTAGTVLLDGVDTATLDRAELRDVLGVVFQDYTVYHVNAADNIGFGRPDRLGETEQIRQAAARTGLAQVIERLPDGYDTVLGRFWEKGHELSGGQRQLVALARAVFRDSPVLVLDEPSAALDVRAETEFFLRILTDRVGTERTTLLATHRLAPVRRAEKILVLADGRIRESGSHEQLVRAGGRYAELFSLQSAGYRSAGPPDATADGVAQ